MLVGFMAESRLLYRADISAHLMIIAAAPAAVDNYVLWQKSKLGRDINPSELIVRVMAAGAKRVAVTAPVFKVTTDTQVAICSTKTVTLGGIEDA